MNVTFLQKINGRLTILLYFDTNNILASILSLYTQPSFSSSYDDLRQGSHSDLVSYPLGHLGGSRSDRNGGRNDRNRNQNRDRYRNNSNNRSQGNRGGPSNQGPGILGAKPGDRSVPELPANPMQVPGLVKLYFWSVFTMSFSFVVNLVVELCPHALVHQIYSGLLAILEIFGVKLATTQLFLWCPCFFCLPNMKFPFKTFCGICLWYSGATSVQDRQTKVHSFLSFMNR